MSGVIKHPNLEDLMHGTVTIVNSYGKINIQGTGFLYTKFENPEINGCYNLVGIWLVTCKHIVIPHDADRKSYLADKIEFKIRKVLDDDSVEWLGMSICDDELKSRLKIHPDPNVDIVVIDVFDRVMNLIDKAASKSLNILRFDGINNMHLPMYSKIQMHGGDDVVVIGFPKGFYDDTNKYPVLKSGMIASRWGLHFKGNPMFLLDSKLLEGSSGSPVVSKPSQFAMENGRLLWNETPQYVFLGVYSGNYAPSDVTDDDKYEQYCFGSVWYSDLVPWIIDYGITLSNDND